MKKMINCFFTNGYFTLGGEGEIEISRCFGDRSALLNLADKILDKYDNYRSICCRGSFYRYFRKFKRVNRADQGRVANEFHNILVYERENCYIPGANGCFLDCDNFGFTKDFTKEYFEFIESNNRRTNVMTHCRIPEFFEGCKIDIGIYDLKSKRILRRSVKEISLCLYIHKNCFCVIWKN